jgi:hypothetical protein
MYTDLTRIGYIHTVSQRWQRHQSERDYILVRMTRCGYLLVDSFLAFSVGLTGTSVGGVVDTKRVLSFAWLSRLARGMVSFLWIAVSNGDE